MGTYSDNDPQSREEVTGESVRESDASNDVMPDTESTAFETSDRKNGGSNGLNGGATHIAETADA